LTNSGDINSHMNLFWNWNCAIWYFSQFWSHSHLFNS